MTLPWSTVLVAFSIFVMRLCDVSIGTARVILLTRGQKYYAAILGFSCVRVFTQAKGTELSSALRDADFGVTQMLGRGRDGKVYVLETAARRGDVHNVRRIAAELDGQAFVMVEPCGSVFQGHVRQGKWSYLGSTQEWNDLVISHGQPR